MKVLELQLYIIASPWLPLVVPTNHIPIFHISNISYFEVFTHFGSMKISELQMSILASPRLTLVVPSNHILSR